MRLYIVVCASPAGLRYFGCEAESIEGAQAAALEGRETDRVMEVYERTWALCLEPETMTMQ